MAEEQQVAEAPVETGQSVPITRIQESWTLYPHPTTIKGDFSSD